MILHEITHTEDAAVYRKLEYANTNRQLDFLESVVEAALETDRPFLSQTLIKALNFHAIACLHVNAGEYRPCEVTVGEHRPPEHFRVPALMDDFVNTVNLNWDRADPFFLAAYVYWRLNHVHPFINGNGRTSRACCYFVLCVKAGGLLSGRPTLPALMQADPERCVRALRQADFRHEGQRSLESFLGPLSDLVRELLDEQLRSANL